MRRRAIEAQTLANILPGARSDLRSDPGAEQDRPARRRAGARRRRDRRTDRRAGRRRSCSSRPRPGRECRAARAVVERIPPPAGDPDAPPRALIFDSGYDQYRGVVGLRAGGRRRLSAGRGDSHDGRLQASTRSTSRLLLAADAAGRRLGAGEVGYLIAGIKDVGQARVGDTVTDPANPATEPLPGYRDAKPMVFCGLTRWTARLPRTARCAREADAQRRRAVLGAGDLGRARFRLPCGFLGLLHMDIVRERLEREYDLVADRDHAPVVYRGHAHRRRGGRRSQPRGACPTGTDRRDREPMIRATVMAPKEYIGAVMELCRERRGVTPAWSTSRPSGSAHLQHPARRRS